MKNNLSQFRDTKRGACWVCGTGPSLRNLMKDDRYTLLPSFGVNAIGLDFFHPDYLVMVDRVQADNRWDERPELLERAKSIHESKSKYAFSRFDNDFITAKWIPISFVNLVDYDCDYCLGKGKMFACCTATITAISVAIWMGFTQIGVIGFDLVRHPLKRHHTILEDACVKILDYCKKNGIEILNLSEESLIESLPKATIEQFIQWYGG